MDKFFLMFRAFKYRNFRLFFPGLAISQIGIWIQNIAISYLVYELTKSPLVTGTIMGINAIPMFVLTPFSGVVADKFNRKKLLLTVQILFTIQALLMTLFSYFGALKICSIIVLGLFLNSVAALDAPLRQSTFVLLVDDKRDLNNAISLNSSCFNVARLVGPAIAGMIIAYSNITFCFLINFVCLLPSIFLIPQMIIEDEKSEHVKEESILSGLKEGFVYVSKQQRIYVLQIFLAVFCYLTASFPILLPMYTKEVMHANADMLGFLMSAMGIGSLLASLLLAMKTTNRGMKYVLIFGCSFAGICSVLTGFTHNFYFALLALFGLGFGITASLTPQNTLIQGIVDDDVRGRVMSINTICFLGTMSISNLTAGAIAEFFGIANTFFILGAILLILIFVFGRIFVKYDYEL